MAAQVTKRAQEDQLMILAQNEKPAQWVLLSYHLMSQPIHLAGSLKDHASGADNRSK